MARVETTDGVARILPDAAPPDSRQRIAVSPDAFGAQVAAAKERGGQVISKIGAEAFDSGEHFARVQVDDQTSKGFADVNKHLEEFRTLEGRARLDAEPRIQKAMDDSFKVYREGLKLPFQQAEYDRKVAGFKNGYLTAQMSNLRESADKSYKVQVAKAGIDQWSNVAAFGAGDPTSIAAAREHTREYFVNLLEAEGNDSDPTLYANAIATADRLIAKNVVDARAVTDPKAALEYADANREALGHEYVPLANGLRTRLKQQDEFDITNQVFTEVGHEFANPEGSGNRPRASGIREAIYDQEGGPPTNPTQIQKSTWDQWQQQGLVHEGDRFGDPASMQAVSDRAIAKYEQDYKDPERVAVAWFSGPGNVAPAGAAQPFVADLQDRNKKSVSSYVADIRDKIGAPKGAMYAAQASVYSRALEKTKDRPELQAGVIRLVNERFTTARTAALQSEAAVKAQTNSAIQSYGDAIRKGTPGQPWNNDPLLDPGQKSTLDKLQENKVKEGFEGSASNPGQGFAKAFQDVQTGAIKNEQQLLPLVRSGALTPWGYDYVSDRLKKYSAPGAETAKRLETEQFASAKRQVSLDNFNRGGTPEGLKRWDAAILAGSTAIEQAREKGKTDAEIFNQESKDGFWAAIKPFLPTAVEKAKAAIEDDKRAAGPFDWRKIDTEAQAVSLWQQRLITDDQAKQLMVMHGWGDPNKGKPVVPNTEPLAKGQLQQGNLDPFNRPTLKNPDGTTSTTSSISIGTDKGEVLIPTVVDGKRLTNAEAIEHFKKTGEHFGIFSRPEDADAFAVDLHNRQADKLGLQR